MTQFGVWVTGKSVAFQRHRFATSTEMQEGVVDATDYKVAQNSGGANMSVDVALGKAWVQIDSGARNGLAFVYSDAQEDPVIAASNATNPRIDQVVLQYNDTVIPAGVGGDVPTVRVLTGTPTAGATLDNRNGAAALPNDCVRLADILVPAASVSVVTANIRDRRPWARGARYAARLTPGAGTTLASPGVAIDSTNGRRRIECSGAPLVARLMATHRNTTAGAEMGLALLVDAVVDRVWSATAQATSPNFPMTVEEHFNGAGAGMPVAVGSKLFDWNEFATGGTATVQAAAVLIEERVSQQADNGTA